MNNTQYGSVIFLQSVELWLISEQSDSHCFQQTDQVGVFHHGSTTHMSCFHLGNWKDLFLFYITFNTWM